MNITDSRRYEPAQVIFEEGARDDAFFVTLEGTVRVTKGGVLLAELGPGGHFGEMAMVDKAPRSATVTALGAVRALVIQRQQFYELMRRDPVMSVKLTWSFIQVLNTRLRMTNKELLAARDTIDVLRRHQVGGVLAEMPMLDPTVAAVGALPVEVTDELIPGFLFTESEAGGTDPLLRADGDGDAQRARETAGRAGASVPSPPAAPSTVTTTLPSQEALGVPDGPARRADPASPARVDDRATVGAPPPAMRVVREREEPSVVFEPSPDDSSEDGPG